MTSVLLRASSNSGSVVTKKQNRKCRCTLNQYELSQFQFYDTTNTRCRAICTDGKPCNGLVSDHPLGPDREKIPQFWMERLLLNIHSMLLR